jgi:phage terminase small subunit
VIRVAKPRSERSYRNDIIAKMNNLGVYREEYSAAIERLAKMYVQRDEIEAQFKASGGAYVVEHTNKAGATNMTKNPYLSALSDINSQLISHERELGLTPGPGRRSANQKKEKGSSGFAAALSEALEGAGA